MEGTTLKRIRALRSTERGISLLYIISTNRCMDIHLKKLNEIKRANTVKRSEETKKVDEYLNRRHNDKMRTAEFEKQGIEKNSDDH